jgi:hypothetical protein
LRSPITAPGLRYEQRLILFIDFLGFKEIVARTEHDPAALRRLVAALNDVGRIGEGATFRSQRVTQFSDSVVLSYRVSEPSGVFWMLNTMALTVISLAGRGFLLRGAVTIGALHHTRCHVVGPAMVRAYEMESTEARHPRVIVDPAVIPLARQRRNVDHTPDDEEEYVRSFLAEDDDGRLFFDYISWQPVVAVAGGDDDLYPDYLATLSELLRDGLAHENTGVVSKYLWLHQRYHAAVTLFTDMPADAPYRRSNPDNCDAIEALPRLAREARAARRRVNAAASPRRSRTRSGP